MKEEKVIYLNIKHEEIVEKHIKHIKNREWEVSRFFKYIKFYIFIF